MKKLCKRFGLLLAVIALFAVLVPFKSVKAGGPPTLYVNATANNQTVYSSTTTAPTGKLYVFRYNTEPSYDKVYIEYLSGSTWYTALGPYSGSGIMEITLPSAALGKTIRLKLTTNRSILYSPTEAELLIFDGAYSAYAGTLTQPIYAPSGECISEIMFANTNLTSVSFYAGYGFLAGWGDLSSGIHIRNDFTQLPPVTQISVQCGSGSIKLYYPPKTVPLVALTAPTVSWTIQYTGSNPTGVVLSWNKVAGATSYEILRNGVLIATRDCLTTTYTDSNVALGQTWTYTVRAKNSVASIDGSANVVFPPPAPTSGPTVTFNRTSNTVELSWSAVSGASSYVVYRDGTAVSYPTGTSASIGSPGGNVTSNYAVAAKNSSGTSPLGPATTYTTPPAAPTSVNATWANSDHSVTVSWAGSTGATKYYIYENGTKIGESTTTSYKATNRQHNTTYSYKVSAVSSNGESPDSTVKTITTPPAEPTVSVQSGPLSWSNNADGNTPGRGFIRLTWPSVPGATGYYLEIHDGYTWRSLYSGSITVCEWDSRTHKIYPAESAYKNYTNDTISYAIIRSSGDGVDLKDTPNLLYQKTSGETYDNDYSYHVRVASISANGWSDYVYLTVTLDCRTDTTKPVIDSVKINGGQLITSIPRVTVDVSAHDPLVANWTSSTADDASGFGSIRFSNDGTNWSAWEPFTGEISKAWDLASDTAGLKTVYVQVMDVAGNVSDVGQGKISFYLVDPNPPSVRGEIIGGPVVYSQGVTLRIEAKDDISPQESLQMRFSNDGNTWSSWEVFQPFKNWTLLAGDGEKRVYVQVKDLANNYGTAILTCTLKTTGIGPQVNTGVFSTSSGKSGTYKNGSTDLTVNFTRTPEVTITVNVSGPIEYSFDNLNWIASDSSGATKSITLSDWDGYKTVYIRTSTGQVYLQRFVLDTTPPKISAWWLGDATIAPGGSVTLIVDAQDNISLPNQLELSVDGGNTWQPYTATKNLTLTGSGYVSVVVQVRDQAGNIAQKVLQIYVQ